MDVSQVDQSFFFFLLLLPGRVPVFFFPFLSSESDFLGILCLEWFVCVCLMWQFNELRFFFFFFLCQWWSVVRSLLLFCIIHHRGGSEMGLGWYLDGKLENKRNTFLDALQCSQHLLQMGITQVANPPLFCCWFFSFLLVRRCCSTRENAHIHTHTHTQAGHLHLLAMSAGGLTAGAFSFFLWCSSPSSWR